MIWLLSIEFVARSYNINFRSLNRNDGVVFVIYGKIYFLMNLMI